MVNKRASSSIQEGTSGKGDDNALEEICVAIDKLRLYNLILEENVHNIS